MIFFNATHIPRGICFHKPEGPLVGGGGASRVRLPSFASMGAAREVLVPDLIDLLRDPNFSGANLDHHQVSYFRVHSQLRHIYPVLDLVAEYKYHHQLTEDVLARSPELADRYREKFGPLIIRIWEEAYAEKTKGYSGELLPRGLFANTPQGKLNFDIVFKFVVENHLGLKFDRATRTVPPELFRKNQPAFRSRVLGLANAPSIEEDEGADAPKNAWYLVFIKFLIRGGLESIYSGNAYQAFSDPANYRWAFAYQTKSGKEYPEGKHLHWSDFKQGAMWDNLSPRSPAWREIDHLIRRHWEITVIDETTGIIDPRLFPDQHEALLAQLKIKLGSDFEGWADLFNRHGFGGLIVKPDFKGQPGKILQLRYPTAFIPKPDEKFLRTHWFKSANLFASVEETRAAVWQEVEFQKVAEKEVPRVCNRAWFRSVYLDVLLQRDDRPLTMLQFFRETFPEKFANGTWHEGNFPAVGTRYSDKPVSFRKIELRAESGRNEPYGPFYSLFYCDGCRLYLPPEYAGQTIKRASADHFLIYRRVVVVGADEKRAVFKPAKAILLQPYLSETVAKEKREIVLPAAAVVELNDPRLPDWKTFERFIPDLLDAGLTPHRLSLDTQKNIVDVYKRFGETGLARFIEVLKVKATHRGPAARR